MVGQQQPGARIVRFSDSLGRLELVVGHATPRFTLVLVSAILQEPSIATGIDKRSCGGVVAESVLQRHHWRWCSLGTSRWNNFVLPPMA
jgi:hypothetical protein